jgi:hypothetical protein
LKRGEIFCVKVSQEKVSLNFKEHLNDGNLWLFAISLSKGFVASSFEPRILSLI